MDDVDKGNHQAEMTLQAYIERVRRRVEQETLPTGYCFNCEEPIAPPHLFCSAECRADFEKRELLAAKLRNHKG